MSTIHPVAEITLRYNPEIISPIQIQSADQAFNIIYPFYDLDTIHLKEQCFLLLLNRANRPLGVYKLSEGGLSSTIIDVKIVLSVALKAAASAILLSHNHPSGKLSPSESDLYTTSRIEEACKVVDIQFLDHIIVGPGGNYFSLQDVMHGEKLERSKKEMILKQAAITYNSGL